MLFSSSIFEHDAIKQPTVSDHAVLDRFVQPRLHLARRERLQSVSGSMTTSEGW